jgi:hypothetical protein
MLEEAYGKTGLKIKWVNEYHKHGRWAVLRISSTMHLFQKSIL